MSAWKLSDAEILIKQRFAEEWSPMLLYEPKRDRIRCRKCGGSFETIRGAKAHAMEHIEDEMRAKQNPEQP